MKPTDEPPIAHPVAGEAALRVGELCRVFETHADDPGELGD